jgi:hypothetical protein
MTNIKVKILKQDGSIEYESLSSYCLRLSKKNNSILYLLESYLEKKLLDDPQLTEIRDIILTVSAEMSKLNTHLIIENGDSYELQ